MKELREITDEITKQSEELLEQLLEHLEETLEFNEEIHQELAELKQQQSKVNKVLLLGANVTALYSLMLVFKIIMIAIQ